MIVSLNEAISIIKKGGVVAVPTETVYGLGADAFNAEAVKKTFHVKGRPADNPLIVHISTLDQLRMLASDIPDEVLLLAEFFWPGPLTVVLHKKTEVPDIVTGGMPTIAIRMPNHRLTSGLIDETGPITAPSANKSGRPSPTKASHIEEEYDGSIPVIEGGASEIGLESTVLDLTVTPFIILRKGKIGAKELEHVLGKQVEENSLDRQETKKSPGTRYTHYKPNASVHWFDPNSSQIDEDGYYLLHNYQNPSLKKCVYYDLDFDMMARELYDHFRTADHLNFKNIYIEVLPTNDFHPLISPLRDRINRASGH